MERDLCRFGCGLSFTFGAGVTRRETTSKYGAPGTATASLIVARQQIYVALRVDGVSERWPFRANDLPG